MDPFNAIKSLNTAQGDYTFWSLQALENGGHTELAQLPFAIRILLESVLRQVDGHVITEADVVALAAWKPKDVAPPNIPFLPARVIMQDFTGVPAVVDLAAMRSALARMGGDPSMINPRVPVDLVIDHSVQVDFFASAEALQRNAEIEFQRGDSHRDANGEYKEPRRDIAQADAAVFFRFRLPAHPRQSPGLWAAL